MATLRLICKSHLASDVWTFQFAPHPSFSWTAGQFIRVELPHDRPDAKGTRRWFTISAAPFEKYPAISTHITSTTFKQALLNLPVEGALNLLEVPDGDFTWMESNLHRVFVAAGIGITPFRSIVMQRSHDKKPLPVTLIYANRTDEIPFKQDLDAVAATDGGLKVQYVTRQLLTAESLRRMAPNIMDSLVYISGAEPMVEALGDSLRATKINAEQLKQDFFPNYDDTNY